MIKYQCSNKRIGDYISIEDFMQSPLKHATHPDQLFQLGIQFDRFLGNLKTSNNIDANISSQIQRFKKVFYDDK